MKVIAILFLTSVLERMAAGIAMCFSSVATKSAMNRFPNRCPQRSLLIVPTDGSGV